MNNSPGETAGSRIKFANPPINELVISLYHIPVIELKAQHIGSYWDRIRARYPLCEQQQPVINLPEAAQAFVQAPGEVFPLPRFWFYNNTDPTLIQVQRNAFMLNWRRATASPDTEYPHYEVVAKNFWEELENYRNFLQELIGGKLDPIQRCELTYINIITASEFFAAPAQLGNVFPALASLSELEADNRQLAGITATVTYRVNPTLLIDLAIRLGQRADTNELGVICELKAHGVPSDLSLDGARAWYDTAHDATYRLFLDATAKAVQETIWKPR
jgi:uncharacterized protein (TIGR04255 family)